MADSIRASASVEPPRRRLPLPGVRRAATAPLGGWVRTPAAVVGVGLTAFVLAIAAFADVLAPGNPFEPIARPLVPPTLAHPFGTDDLGRDLLTGVVHGVRTSIFVALGAGSIALPLGVVIGAVAGWRGGRLDDALMRFSEVWQVTPRFFLAVVVIALFGAGLDRIILVLGLTSWALLARIVRAEVLSLREREFVEAARAVGSTEWRLVRRQILPHVFPAAIVYITLLLAHVCLVEATLGFLGLSDPNAISLGYLAAQAQRFLRVAWWMWLFPGVALFAIVIGFNLLGDALTDRIRGSR